MLSTNILLAVILVVNVFFLVFISVFSYRLVGFYRQFKVFISPKADNQTSPLADSIQIVADMVGRAVTAGLKATFMANNSASVRAEKAIEGDIAQDMISQSGTLGSLLTSFPTLRKTLRRNPQLLDVAMNFLAKNNGVKTNQSEQVKFKL